VPLTFNPSAQIPAVGVVESPVPRDDRGWLMETFKASEFAKAGLPTAFLQDNQTFTASEGTIRGLHLQLGRAAQGKLVRCTAGAMFDVAVDLRRDSPTFAQWVGCRLSANDGRAFWIPEGFAHGFMSLVPSTMVHYKNTREYSPADARTVRWNDPRIGIDWPLDGLTPSLAARDATAPLLNEVEPELV